MNKIYVRKDPIDIPERLGPDMDDEVTQHKEKEREDIPKVDLSCLVTKFEFNEDVYATKEPILLGELLEKQSENKDTDKLKENVIGEDMPSFDIGNIKNVFTLGEQNPSLKEDSNETTTDITKQEEKPKETKLGSRQGTPVPSQKDLAETASIEPAGFSETKSFTEHFSNIDEFGNTTVGTRHTATSVSEHSETVPSKPAPFSYADAVKKTTQGMESYDEASTEELLRNFHKTWTESETVFKSLGYSVSEETSLTSHQSRTVVMDSSSEVRAVHGVSEEGVSDGCADGGQKEVP